MCAQAAEQEREERKRMIERDQDAFADKMMRTVGILLNARLMEEREFKSMYYAGRKAAAWSRGAARSKRYCRRTQGSPKLQPIITDEAYIA